MMISETTVTLFLNGALLSALFSLLSFKLLWYVMGTFIEVPRRHMYYLIIGSLSDLIVFSLIFAPFVYLTKGYPVPDALQAISSIPVFVLCFYCILSGLMTMHVRHTLVQWRKTHVTYKTLHQALDNLPIGVCVYNQKGILELVNYQMQSLCRRHTGTPLLNGKIWEKAVSDLPDLMLGFSDEEIWHFKKFIKNENTTLLTATNVSEEMKLNHELMIENIQLEGINNRMRQYGLDLEDIIKQEELLNAQIRVHDELGHILLTSKVFMNGSDFAVSERQLKKEWKNLLLSMKNYMDTAKDESQLNDLVKAAKTLGIDIILQGKLPANQTMRHLLASAARECLTNAAKAGASRLWIKAENPTAAHPTTRISFTNDGMKPDGPIREGVGLGTLRQIVEREGASMKIKAEDAFCLSIEM